MMFQGKLDRALKKLHEDKLEKDGDLTEEQVEAIKDEIDKKDVFAMIVSAMIVILPVAIIALVLMALVGYLFLVH